MSVPEESRLIVRLKDGRQIDGTVVEITQQQLTLLQNKQPVPIAAVEIQSIERITGRSKGKSALIAGAAAAATGAVLGAVFTDTGASTSRGETSIGSAIGLGLFGALFGWIAGSPQERVLIFDAP